MKPYFFFLVFTLNLLGLQASAQSDKKRELRATWIATVANIDWPSNKHLSASRQKEEFVKILDEHKENGMNAVIVQVRPVADVLYPSSLEPWSAYLTGEQGKSPTPYYNPLAFMIEEAHKRNMEFHAWFNPYRASMGSSIDHISTDHPLKLHPEWFVEYASKWYYNPGNPEARSFVLNAIMEVVKHYNLDAVHFDDYFYPYRKPNLEFPDEETFQKHGAEYFTDKENWRRYNVDAFVEELSYRIKKEKPFVKFGISPFGVWRNKSKDPEGSNTRAGQTNYDDLYADVLKWLREGWIDYVTPQIYWHIGHSSADYKTLVEWWSKHTYGKHLYIGHSAYKVGGKYWEKPTELINQLEWNARFPNVKGSMFFSSKSLTANPLGVRDLLRDYYKDEAVIPKMRWIDNTPPPSPRLSNVKGNRHLGITIEWEDKADSDSEYYIIYRFEGEFGGMIEDASQIIAKVKRDAYTKQSFTDKNVDMWKKYSYAVTAVDRLHNESRSSNQVAVKHRFFFGVKVLQ